MPYPSYGNIDMSRDPLALPPSNAYSRTGPTGYQSRELDPMAVAALRARAQAKAAAQGRAVGDVQDLTERDPLDSAGRPLVGTDLVKYTGRSAQTPENWDDIARGALSDPTRNRVPITGRNETTGESFTMTPRIRVNDEKAQFYLAAQAIRDQNASKKAAEADAIRRAQRQERIDDAERERKIEADKEASRRSREAAFRARTKEDEAEYLNRPVAIAERDRALRAATPEGEARAMRLTWAKENQNNPNAGIAAKAAEILGTEAGIPGLAEATAPDYATVVASLKSDVDEYKKLAERGFFAGPNMKAAAGLKARIMEKAKSARLRPEQLKSLADELAGYEGFDPWSGVREFLR